MRAAVFCGSALGTDTIYVKKTEELVKTLASNNVDLVYGGGQVGLMGSVADTAVANGIHIIGVMPKALADHELAHANLSELIIVNDMHERKSVMADKADCFIALPGGAGTLEEFFEVWTWAQLGFHGKPCVLYNVRGYFDPLLEFFTKMIAEGFMKQSYYDMLIVSDSPKTLIDNILSYTPPRPKWTGPKD